jgi:MbtH protein
MPSTNPFDNDDKEYLVIVNHENQYSLWPIFREVPKGWTHVGKQARRRECLDWIAEHWKDMRPASLIREMNSVRND